MRLSFTVIARVIGKSSELHVSSVVGIYRSNQSVILSCFTFCFVFHFPFPTLTGHLIIVLVTTVLLWAISTFIETRRTVFPYALEEIRMLAQDSVVVLQ